MAKQHGKDTVILYAQFDLSSFFSNADIPTERALDDATAFGDGGEKTIPGLHAGTVSLEGFFDGDANAVHEVLSGQIRAAGTKICSIAIEGGSFGVGKRVAMLDSREASYGASAPVAGAVTVRCELRSDDEGIQRGIGLHALAAETATANGASNDNTASTASGLAAHLHVTAASGTTPSLTVKIQHSTDNSVWTDLVTFTAATGVTSERKKATGTVNRYVRAIWTISGTTPSFTFAVAVARL